MTDWVSQPHMWIWAATFAWILIFEVYTLWWNTRRRKTGDPRRANLTAYVQAFFGTGDRRLKHGWNPLVMIVVVVYFLGHFAAWWP